MSRKKTTGSDLKDLDTRSQEFFSRTRIPFEKGRVEVWEDLTRRIREGSVPSGRKTIGLHPARQWISLAASVALVVSVTALIRYYRVTTSCSAGEQVSRELPDGSVAELNGPTTLSVHPLWWPFSRRVEMKGEAFFHVSEGRSFRVSAPQGTTRVLGTAFNIYARDNRFEVTCHSGRVLVSATGSEHSVTLSQDQAAELNRRGSFDVLQVSVDRFSPSWKSNLMIYTSTPLRQVFDVIERQYGIRIVTPDGMDHTYSGRFATDLSVDNILSLVCRPFDLVYERKSDTEYHVYPAAKDL